MLLKTRASELFKRDAELPDGFLVVVSPPLLDASLVVEDAAFVVEAAVVLIDRPIFTIFALESLCDAP
jgi:hypothetical protein